MSPKAAALLAMLKERPLPSAEFVEVEHLEPMRELCALGLADLYEPPPYEWRLTLAGRNYGEADV